MQGRVAPAAGRSAPTFLEHLPPHGDLGHLEGDVAAAAESLGADLDQLPAARWSATTVPRFVLAWRPPQRGRSDAPERPHSNISRGSEYM